MSPSVTEPVSNSAKWTKLLAIREEKTVFFWTPEKNKWYRIYSTSNKRIHNVGRQCCSGTFSRHSKSLTLKESLPLILAYCKPVIFLKTDMWIYMSFNPFSHAHLYDSLYFAHKCLWAFFHISGLQMNN